MPPHERPHRPRLPRGKWMALALAILVNIVFLGVLVFSVSWQNRQPEAISLLKKLLVAEPDNLRIQIRLADLYHAMGQNADAIEAYVSAAQRALARGDQVECEKLVERALKIDPVAALRFD